MTADEERILETLKDALSQVHSAHTRLQTLAARAPEHSPQVVEYQNALAKLATAGSQLEGARVILANVGGGEEA